MKALILAAGLGKRMRPLTLETPKALVELKGKALLQHVLEKCRGVGVKECVIVVGYLKEKIIERFGKEFEGMRLQYVVQEEVNGTAKGVETGKEFLSGEGLNEKEFLKETGLVGGEFLVMSADVIVPEECLKGLVGEEGFDAVLLVREEEFPERYGVVEVEGERVVGLEEKPEKTKSNLVNAGVYKFSERIFEMIARTEKNAMREEYEITDSIKLLLEDGWKVGFVKCEGEVLDIGSLKDLERANE